MKKIEVVSSVRGFLINLFEYQFDNIEFRFEREKVYEITNQHSGFFYRLFMSPLMDKVGLIYVKAVNTECDNAISYNRILKSNKPYYLIVENPTALYHYRLARNKGFLAKFIFKKYINDDKVAGVICMSKACYKTFEKVTGITWLSKLYQIYPLIPDYSYIERDFGNKLKCLFISSQFELKGGKEIIEVAKRLLDINFTIVTCIDKLDAIIKEDICHLPNVILLDFKFNNKEMDELYRSHHILLNPTRQDSFSLVVLEAIKRGMPIISTKLYAIKEMVVDGYNGFLMEPKYPFFDEKDMPNPVVWNHRQETIYSDYTDPVVIEFLHNKILTLNSDRKKLEQFSLNSLTLSKTRFGEEKIARKWQEIILENEVRKE